MVSENGYAVNTPYMFRRFFINSFKNQYSFHYLVI